MTKRPLKDGEQPKEGNGLKGLEEELHWKWEHAELLPLRNQIEDLDDIGELGLWRFTWGSGWSPRGLLILSRSPWPL